MKTAGIILIVMQVMSLISTAIRGDNIFAYGFSGIAGFANLLGRLSFGIVGIILLVAAHKRKNK